MNATSGSPIRGLGGIFLIGFMGSGKTHWGKIWAAANQLSFVDLDEIIEKKTGKTIAAIFEKEGEGHFRKIEAEVLRTCAGLQNTIVACGGGTPCFFNNMQWMNEQGITIYITSEHEQILQRVLSEREKRPVLKKIKEAELLFFIEQKIKEREPFYTMARLTVQSSLLNKSSLSGLIATVLSK